MNINVNNTQASASGFTERLLKEYDIDLRAMVGDTIIKKMVGDALSNTPTLVTQSNIGVPIELATFFDMTNIVSVLQGAMTATDEAIEIFTGSFEVDAVKYRIDENTGTVDTYDDYNFSGVASVNSNWNRQGNYRFQTTMNYGTLETERQGLAGISLIQKRTDSAINTIARYHNQFQYYGVQGKDIYGIMNSPVYNANITFTPQPDNASGTTAIFANMSPQGKVNAISQMYSTLAQQLTGQLTGQLTSAGGTKARMTLIMSPYLEASLTQTNIYGLTARPLLMQMYPNLKIVASPQYDTSTGQIMKLQLDSIRPDNMSNPDMMAGILTTSMKFRAFQLIPQGTFYQQKFAGSTLGYRLNSPAMVVRATAS